MVKIKQFIAGSCLSYVLESGKDALIIDAHVSLKDEYVNFLKKKNLLLWL